LAGESSGALSRSPAQTHPEVGSEIAVMLFVVVYGAKSLGHDKQLPRAVDLFSLLNVLIGHS